MKKTILLFSLIFNIQSSFAFEHVSRLVNGEKELTVLVYIAAVNNLADFVKQDIDEMQKIGSNERLNILVHLNTWNPVEGKVTKKLVIQKGKTIQVGEDEVKDSGDPQTLIEACSWAHEDFPSKHFVLVLWDHGSGSINRNGLERSWLWLPCEDDEQARAVCYDDITGNFLTDDKLVHALSTVCNNYRQGKKIDIVSFDACLMANIEVAYAVEPYARYMVASQETIPGKGFGYHHVLEKPSRNKMGAASLARFMTTAYRMEYGRRSRDYTLSALDLQWLDPVVKNVEYVAKLLTDFLNDKKYGSAVHVAIKKSVDARYCTQFSDYSYIDLGNFYQNLISNLSKLNMKGDQRQEELIDELSNGLQYIRNCIIANVYGKNYRATSGLSIYFMRKKIDPTYPSLIWSKDTSWLSFLTTYEGMQDSWFATVLPMDYIFNR